MQPFDPSIKTFLDEKFALFHQQEFIEEDPIAIPHTFSKKQDIEISGFLTATIAWGNRKTILHNATTLMQLMDHAPHDFITQASTLELEKLGHFKHRTFQFDDLAYFLYFFRWHYSQFESLEDAFLIQGKFVSMQKNLSHFHDYFLSLDQYLLSRTRKHIANPAKNSSCKRINMFLRWMVRKKSPIDFGIWSRIPLSSLMVPLDVHVGNVARNLGILQRSANDWQALEELMAILRQFDAKDPAKYDYALFGYGVNLPKTVIKPTDWME